MSFIFEFQKKYRKNTEKFTEKNKEKIFCIFFCKFFRIFSIFLDGRNFCFSKIQLQFITFSGHQRFHHFSTNVSSFSPQDYLNNPMFDSLNNHRSHRYWPHTGSSSDRTITLRPLTSKKLNSGALHRKMMAPRSACKVLS